MRPMDSILVVNAGSSSVKFQLFALDGAAQLTRKIKGQIEGIGTRPRFRASGSFAGSHLCCGRPDCVAEVVGLELRNVGANYPFEGSHRFAGIQPNLSCGVGHTQLRQHLVPVKPAERSAMIGLL
jgi:hypothetical protein